MVEMIKPAPEGFNISREAWARTPSVVRDEIIRAHWEMSEGIAIAKDRYSGRNKRVPGKPDPGKRVLGGWWELHCCEHNGNHARAAELRELLAPEAAQIAQSDSLAEYHAMAAKAGKRLPDVLRQYIELENFCLQDPVAGISHVMRNVGVDPEVYARWVLAEPEVA